MTEKKRAFTRKTALSIVLLCAAALLLLIIFRWYGSCQTDLSTPEGRESFLSGLGWEIDRATEEHRSVIIPDTLEGAHQLQRLRRDGACHPLCPGPGDRGRGYPYHVHRRLHARHQADRGGMSLSRNRAHRAHADRPPFSAAGLVLKSSGLS